MEAEHVLPDWERTMLIGWVQEANDSEQDGAGARGAGDPFSVVPEGLRRDG